MEDADSALEQALIARFGTLGRVPKAFLLRSDSGLAFTMRPSTQVRDLATRQSRYWRLGWLLQVRFIMPHLSM